MSSDPLNPQRSESHEEHVSFWAKFARLYNPKYQLLKLKEDLRSAMGAVKHWHFENSHEYSVLADSFRGKLFAAFFISGMMVWPAMALSTWVQATTRNPTLSTVVMLAFTQVACTLVFQLIWFLSNRELYRINFNRPVERLRGLQKDILPVQWKGFRLVVPVLSLTYPVVTLVVHWITHAFPSTMSYLPAGPLGFLVELLLIGTPFMRAMGDLFESHSKKLAARYVTAA
jgi:hypothetical protein